MKHSSLAQQRLARLGFAACIAGFSMGALAQASYNVFRVPLVENRHLTTLHTYSTAINRHGLMANALYQEAGGGAALRCDKTQCVYIPPLDNGCHHCSVSAHDINDAGLVVGNSPYMWFGRGYVFDGTTARDIGAFDEGWCGGCEFASYAYGINNLGQVVGGGETEAGPDRAFIWQDGVMQKLGTLGGDWSYATAINDHSDVVGNSVRLDGQTHAFMYRHGHMQDLGTLGGSWSNATSINLARQVVGCSAAPDETQTTPFIWADGVMTPLPTLGGNWACASRINARGWVVGSSLTAGNTEWHGFLFDGATMIDLNDTLSPPDQAMWVVEYAEGINRKGQIAATGRHRIFGTERALLLNPAKQ